MSRFRVATSLGLTLSALAGCAAPGPGTWLTPAESRPPVYSAISPSPAKSLEILKATPVCCKALSELHLEPLDTEGFRFYEINGAAQAFVFATGKSLVKAFRIPDELERATLTLDAIAGATVFVPSVLILDRDFRVSRAIDASAFRYTPAGFMEPQRLRGRILLDRSKGSDFAGETVLVVFTTNQDLRGTTRMMSEARLYARARGLRRPGLPDPTVPHAATGLIRLNVGDLETSTGLNRHLARQKRDAARYLDPARSGFAPAPPTPPPALGPRATGSRPPPPLSKKTQQMYDEMIAESVSVGDMDRAWRLVDEAERAGSPTARPAFLKAVEEK